MCKVHQIILSKWARKHMHYVDTLVRKEKRKIQELEKKMAKAQLPAPETIAQQVSEELGSQLPWKIQCFGDVKI